MKNNNIKVSNHVVFGKCTDEYGYALNNITSDVVYAKNEVIKSMKNNDFSHFYEDEINMFIDNNIMIEEEGDDEKLTQNLTKSLREFKSELSLLRVMLTDSCNLNCSYCKVVPNVLNKVLSPVPIEKFKYALGLLLSSKYDGQKIVHITGGEPLLYKDRVFELLKTISKMDKEKVLTVVIGTNGILLTEELLKEFTSVIPSLKLIISLDGKPEVNDTFRKKFSGEGSSKEVEKSIKLINDLSIELGISMVVGSHNLYSLQENIDYAINKFSPSSLGTNFMKNPTPENTDFIGLVQPEEYAVTLYDVFKKVRDTGVYMELIMRKIYPFVKKEFRCFDCGASANSTINIDARGNIGPCKSMLIMENEKGIKFDELMETMKSEWQKRSPVYNKNCWKCKALSICGNGCAYEAMISNRDFKKLDVKHCKYSKTFMDCMINDLFEIIKDECGDKNVFVPRDVHRKKIISNVAPTKGTLKWSIGHATISLNV